jgi:hypothetical protein
MGRSKESLNVSGVDLADRIVVPIVVRAIVVVPIEDEQVARPVQKRPLQQVKDVRG